MGTTKISEFLFDIKGKVAKQHAEPIIEKSLYYFRIQRCRRFRT
ncbi:hypothetical protein [Wolbachia endosymbiont of Trichogramma kaykai]